ncbi:hypothetical protein OIU78_025144 [Salix suchowensis]|nr:hypothetical protein OIU78_025144 [Salix suchowensis]
MCWESSGSYFHESGCMLDVPVELLAETTVSNRCNLQRLQTQDDDQRLQIDLGKGWQAILVHRPLAAWLVRLSVPATGNLAGDIIIGLGAHLSEISEEENILTMDSVERVPDLERLIGIEAAISNRSRGGKARVSEFGIQIEAHQFFLIRAESIARE